MFLLLLYSLVSAYLSGIADILHSINLFSTHSRSQILLPGVLLGIVSLTIGQDFCNALNRVAIYILLIGFVILLVLFGLVEQHHLHVESDFSYIIRDGFTVLVAFGYQLVIPSVRYYYS